MDDVEIQLQDESGMWRTYLITINNSQIIQIRMKELKDRHPDLRVRAVNRRGRLVDILLSIFFLGGFKDLMQRER